MESGNYNQRIQLEELVYTPDGAGGQDKSWASYISTWAGITEYKIKTEVIDDQSVNIFSSQFIVRYRSGIIGKNLRITHDGIMMDVKSVQRNPDDRTELILECESA